MRTMRRSGWVDLEPFLFDTNFSDLPGIEIQVNPEFGSMEEALLQADFAPVIGRLPKCLRVDVKTVWIHKGITRLGEGIITCSFIQDRRMIMSPQESWRKPWCMKHPIHRWMAPTPTQMSGPAQERWGVHIHLCSGQPLSGGYSREWLYFALRYREDRISDNLKEVVNETIPNRLAYFDNQGFEYFDEVSGLWNGAKDLGQGWKNLNGWGYFYPLVNGWVYHLGMGWVYTDGKSPESFWFYNHALQKWLWSSTSQFPYLYDPYQNLWLYFHKQKEGSDVFYYIDGAWNRP